jgi:predicted nucleotidyltransferase
MDSRVQEQIEKIKSIIIKTAPVEQLFLFGSYAYGTPNEDSDLDFYVVLRDDAPFRDVEVMDMIGLALYGKKSIPTDIIVSKKSKFQYRLSDPTLEQEVAEKGIMIYG